MTEKTKESLGVACLVLASGAAGSMLLFLLFMLLSCLLYSLSFGEVLKIVFFK